MKAAAAAAAAATELPLPSREDAAEAEVLAFGVVAPFLCRGAGGGASLTAFARAAQLIGAPTTAPALVPDEVLAGGSAAELLSAEPAEPAEPADAGRGGADVAWATEGGGGVAALGGGGVALGGGVVALGGGVRALGGGVWDVDGGETSVTSLPVTSLPVTSLPVTSLSVTSLPVTSVTSLPGGSSRAAACGNVGSKPPSSSSSSSSPERAFVVVIAGAAAVSHPRFVREPIRVSSVSHPRFVREPPAGLASWAPSWATAVLGEGLAAGCEVAALDAAMAGCGDGAGCCGEGAGCGEGASCEPAEVRVGLRALS